VSGAGSPEYLAAFLTDFNSALETFPFETKLESVTAYLPGLNFLELPKNNSLTMRPGTLNSLAVLQIKTGENPSSESGRDFMWVIKVFNFFCIVGAAWGFPYGLNIHQFDLPVHKKVLKNENNLDFEESY